MQKVLEMVRVKLRYLVVEIRPEISKHLQVVTDAGHLYAVIKNKILETHGDFGLASIQRYLNVKYVNPYTNVAIVRTKRGTQDVVSTSLTFLRSLNGSTVVFRTLHVGGTVRSCQKFLAHYHLRQLPQLLHDCKTKSERVAVQKAILGYNAAKIYSFKRKDEVDEGTEDMDIFSAE
ncbi:hypothetical protein LSH36_138g00026 [Paralvinella palmiformis]|uniref:Ribonuclease P/MRP protein subunit POP5 n=1 Tax=Paralvinella palmiformis TaxID=53620 RepID=A0AAD9JWK7_9ANNE|nr:hypothetical protein LSH36_138g00026 [Paralvinella palmiformis]